MSEFFPRTVGVDNHVLYIKLVQYLWAKIFMCVEKPADPCCNSSIEQNVENREVNRVSNKEAGRNFKKN